MSDDIDLPPWRVEASRYVIDDTWLRVRADDCVANDGVRIASLNIPTGDRRRVDDEGCLLLVNQHRHGWGVVSCEQPIDAVDPEDADIVSAGRRELLEMTGYGGGS
ncbi:hypothetical protein F1C10_02810 [Sphingomonas sp. NBWT7]|uniref:hypothetical protein n=1 Tax=Sphingomonas sp. NBWT7 TaxID=2596913 RepID=UPI001627671F|nr:hypothetical protein [Sphingomonas sp. NBWT7]QNE30991.1 hypothetical protein F1C10_02810 [Sphingomonas sp. NBWT7]